MIKIILIIIGILWFFNDPKSFLKAILVVGCLAFMFTHPFITIGLFLLICWIIGWVSSLTDNKKKTTNKTYNDQNRYYQKQNNNNQQYKRQENNNRQQTYSKATYNSYFKGCINKEQLKKRHRELCMKLHPDKGGDAEQFKKMQSEYDMLKKRFK